ncbi:hypothetical protein [Kitasatospora cineracea]|uniref:Uncharacterized protein n=1 Tax=Kitasatospora cineracea TaxID=88074 RepID=A0A8G1XBY0_9ACTN|nr:hypothetical protein [Kitasatospora cineracea]ROR44750.1 hypothetical protein EDD39_2958 [Kitasatospora cineracea]
MTITLDRARLEEINAAKQAECGHSGGSGCAWCWLTPDAIAELPYAERLAVAVDLDHRLTELGIPRAPRTVVIVREARTYAVQVMCEELGTWELRIPAPGEEYVLFQGAMWSDPDAQVRSDQVPTWTRGRDDIADLARSFAGLLWAAGLR